MWGVENIRNTRDVFWDFVFERNRNGETDTRHYDENHPSSKAMKNTFVAKVMRKAYKDEGCKDIAKFINGWWAAAETFLISNNIVQIQVGGFAYTTKSSTLPNGQTEVVYRITNDLSVYSLFYHAIDSKKPRNQEVKKQYLEQTLKGWVY